MNAIERLLQGSIDLHMHVGPDAMADPRLQRRVDVLEAATQAKEAGQRAIVFKNHNYCTAPLALIVAKVVPGISLLGAIALNESVGGLNPHALEIAGKLGNRIVWMPTFSSANHRRLTKSPQKGISLVDEAGKLVPPISALLDIIKQYDMLLATGHVSVQESFALVAEAKRRGISRIIFTHPLSQYVGGTVEDAKRGAEMGAYIEHCFLSTMPAHGQEDPQNIVNAIRAIGAEHCIMTSDFGQLANPPPVEGMRMYIATMLQFGLTEEEIEIMVKRNPAKVAGLD